MSKLRCNITREKNLIRPQVRSIHRSRKSTICSCPPAMPEVLSLPFFISFPGRLYLFSSTHNLFPSIHLPSPPSHSLCFTPSLRSVGKSKDLNNFRIATGTKTHTVAMGAHLSRRHRRRFLGRRRGNGTISCSWSLWLSERKMPIKYRPRPSKFVRSRAISEREREKTDEEGRKKKKKAHSYATNRSADRPADGMWARGRDAKTRQERRAGSTCTGTRRKNTRSTCIRSCSTSLRRSRS